MQTKYRGSVEFLWTRAYRGALRALLRPLVRWQSGPLDEDGCTLVLGCHTDLVDMLPANLGCLQRQDLTGVREILLVFDGNSRRLREMQHHIAERFPELHCRVIVYTPMQRAITRTVSWAWINCWLSWTLGIAAAKTRWVMLHDFDAMLVDPAFVRKRFQAIRQRGCQFLGIVHYDNVNNGVVRDDGFAATIEMMLDAAFVRRTLQPVELFNHVAPWKGRRVDFDTFLWAQSRGGRSEVIPVGLDDVVHPSQMICQYAFLRNGDRRLPLDRNNLMLIPYFVSVGGDLSMLREVTAQMEDGARRGRVRIFERNLDVGPLMQVHVDWIVKQASHLDRALFGEVRPEVSRYLETLDRFVGDARAARGFAPGTPVRA